MSNHGAPVTSTLITRRQLMRLRVEGNADTRDDVRRSLAMAEPQPKWIYLIRRRGAK
jgi:hypothetical protein